MSIEPSTARSAAVLLGFTLTVKDPTSILCFLLSGPAPILSLVVVSEPSPRLAVVAVNCGAATVIPDDLWIAMSKFPNTTDVVGYELG
jgi:NADPH:quinone reductase-like Zn-dependent oxidoreductase